MPAFTAVFDDSLVDGPQGTVHLFLGLAGGGTLRFLDLPTALVAQYLASYAPLAGADPVVTSTSANFFGLEALWPARLENVITTDSWFTATFAGSNPFVTTPGTTVPLPAGLPLALTGLAGLVVLRRRA